VKAYFCINGFVYGMWAFFNDPKNNNRKVIIFFKLFKFVIGYFIQDKPKGKGIIYWRNGDKCSGLFEDNICNGKKTTAFGTEINGKFEWSFEHQRHTFVYGQ